MAQSLLNATAAVGGAVAGGESSTDKAIALWNGTDADTLQDSAVTISPAGKISGVVDPTSNQDAATKKYVDDTATAKVSDTAYNATTWDTVTTIAPSKNAVRDEVEALLTAIAAKVSDTAYDATSWDAVTTIAPSKNAVRDEVEALLTAIAAKVSDTAYDATSWNAVTTIAPSKNAVRDEIEAILASNPLNYKSSDGSAGISTTITTSSLVGKTITVKDGQITGFA